MAVFKCKMCGADLDVTEGMYITECEYCGTKQTVPGSRDENLRTLYNRANNLRVACEFDKAAELYEKIVTSDEEQAEAYFGLVLCKYGIEYVEDPRTFKRVPTCHRCSYDVASLDPNFKSAMKHAFPSQRGLYEAEVKKIDELQREIIARVNDGDKYDVFICYKETDESGKRTRDSVIANDIYHELTDAGMRVFYAAITLEGKLGSAYEPIIFSALNTARVMLVIGTKPEYFNAVWVKNEWSRFLHLMDGDRNRLLIPCYRDMDAYDMPREFAHLQAQDMSKIGFINDIVRGINKVMSGQKYENDATRGATYQINANADNLVVRARLALEAEEFSDAISFAEQALNADATIAEAYLIKFLAENEAVDLDELIGENDTDIVADTDYKRASRFATGELAEKLSEFDRKVHIEECKARYARAEWLTYNLRSEIDYTEAKRLIEESGAYQPCVNLLPVLEEKYAEHTERERKKKEKIEAEKRAEIERKAAELAKKEKRTKIIIISLIAIVLLVVSICVIAAVIDNNTRAGVVYKLTSDGNGYYVDGVENKNVESVTILSEYKGKPVVRIGKWAFAYHKNLKSITIPDSVRYIDQYAFYECTGLTSAIIPDSVTSIENNAFYGCTDLANVVIPETVTSIGGYAFSLCKGLKNIYYAGTQAQWNDLGVDYLDSSVKVHYNYDLNI